MDHTIDEHAPHSHGHDHAHGHDHHHAGGMGEYYLQQLLTVFICGAFGVAGVLMYTLGKLPFILAEPFHLWVLVGSGILLFMTAVRGVALWQSAAPKAHDHGHAHAHGDDCGHNHAAGEKCDHHHGHDHGDHTAADHEHGNIYWRVVVLAFPVAILAMGLPNGSFSAGYVEGKLGAESKIGELAAVQAKDGAIQTDFDTLASAAFTPDKRDAYTGQKASIVGNMRKGSDKQFTLYKLKMTCCSADMIPLKALAVVNAASQLATFTDHQQIEVTGTIQFAQDMKTNEWLTVLRVEDGGIRPK